MTPWTTLTAPVIVIADADIDTDRILPARYMQGLSRRGLGAHLFADARAGDPRFDVRAGTGVLIAGANFGSGSSREHAVWALLDRGIRCVIAPSFGSIFAGNCVSNGVLLITLPRDEQAALIAASIAHPQASMTVDLERGTIALPGLAIAFTVSSATRAALLAGEDAIDRTLRHVDEIARYERSAELA